MVRHQVNRQQVRPQAGNTTHSIGLLNSDWPIWLLAFICVWSGLGAYGVLNNNEGLYAQISFDMQTSGDLRHWIIPHLNGLPYMEKPPLLYWLTAIAFQIFGYAEWVVRLIPTLAGLICVGVILNFGRRIFRPAVGRLAALMFISGLAVMIISRTLVFDMLLTAFLTSALLFAWLFLIQNQKRDCRIAIACLAFAVLAKGFVALILFGLVVMSWIVFLHGRFSWKEAVKWLDPVAFCLFAVITVPWLVAASWVEPIFPWFYFVNEHILRFLGLRLPHDYYSGPWWYYLPRMIIYLFPWSFLVPMAFLAKWKSLSHDERHELTMLRKMLFLGWLVPLLFFSVSSAKANYYLIAVMPFAALHLALLLEQSHFLEGKLNMILGIVIALMAGAAGITLLFLPDNYLTVLVASYFALTELSIAGLPLNHFVQLVSWSVVVLSLIASLVAWRVPKVGVVAYVILPVFFMAILILTVIAIEPFLSGRAMAQFIQKTLPNRPVYMYRNYEQISSLPFYLHKPLQIIESNSNDLYWGDKLRPENPITISLSQFKNQVKAENYASVIIVPNNFLNEFTNEFAGTAEHKNPHSELAGSKRFGDVTVFY